MTATGFLANLGDWVLYAAALMLSIVIVYYHLTARWWKTPEGRHIMAWTAFTWAILVFIASAVSGVMNVEVRLWVRIVIYALFFWLAVWRLVLIAKAQNRPHAPGERPSERVPFNP